MDPDADPDALTDRARALWAEGRRDEAATAARAALALAPAAAQGYLNLAQIDSRQGRLSGAITGAGRAARLAPDDPEALFSWAQGLARSGRPAEAAGALRRVVALQPANIAAHVELANLAHLIGDLPTAFAAMEHRFDVPGYPTPRRHAAVARWAGERLVGRTLLVHAERDFGDAIQYARFLPEVARRGGRIVLECQPELVRLFERLPHVAAVRALGDALPPFERQVPLNSLPFVLAATLATLPRLPYIEAPREPALPAPRGNGRLKVGLVWASRPDSATASWRGIPPETLSALFAVGGIAWYSLQVDARAADLALLGGRLVDLAPSIADFADTAAYMGMLDLVVTVDTAAAHLAGAIGRPVWVLLPRPAAYRWMLEREDSPWYPTMRLLRQREPGNWRHPVDHAAELLAAMAATRR